MRDGIECGGPRSACFPAASLLLALLVYLSLVAAACEGRPSGGGPTTAHEKPVVLDVEQALKADPGSEVYVQGFLFFEGDRVVLASTVLESYPPLPGAPTLRVKGLGLEELVGLSSTTKESGFPAATWSDYVVVLKGTVEDGSLKVVTAPRVVQASAGDLAVRFSPVSEPLRTGEQVWWVFDVLNRGRKAVVLTFASGQKADVTLSRLGSQHYRWSSGRAFTEAIEPATVEPGGSFAVVLSDSLSVERGDYELKAWVTASAPYGERAAPLPQLATTVKVY